MSSWARKVLIVGLGSPFGDDQIGWRIMDALRPLSAERVTLQKARSAGDLFNWLDQDRDLIVCDASQGAGPAGLFRCWSWPSSELSTFRSTGSHDLGLVHVLELAQQIARLPERVTIWAIEGRVPSSATQIPGGDLSEPAAAAVVEVARLIADRLQGAPGSEVKTLR